MGYVLFHISFLLEIILAIVATLARTVFPFKLYTVLRSLNGISISIFFTEILRENCHGKKIEKK